MEFSNIREVEIAPEIHDIIFRESLSYSKPVIREKGAYITDADHVSVGLKQHRAELNDR